MIPVTGACDPRFRAVRDTFVENFERGELGAGCTVVVDGRTVVDLVGGWADEGRTRPWAPDTLVNVYSVGKPIVALSVLQLVAEGSLDLDEPAAHAWPEFVAGRDATVRDVLCHRAGVPAIRRELGNDALWDWDTMAAAVAETEPWWPPGTRHGYHVNTYGYVTGELARRRSGQLPGEWLAGRVAGPLGADLAWGLPADEQRRCAEVVWEVDLTPVLEEPGRALGAPAQAIEVLAYFNPPGISSIGVVNTTEWRATQVPSTNLHATAGGIARVYAALTAGGTLDGITIIDRDLLAEATTVQSEGWCQFLDRDVSFGLGFQPTRADRPFGPNPGSYGHYGTGGALGFADPAAGIAFGYVMNSVRPRWQNARNQALIAALYSCV